MNDTILTTSGYLEEIAGRNLDEVDNLKYSFDSANLVSKKLNGYLEEITFADIREYLATLSK